MTDGNTHAIAQHLDEREDWDALQEVTTELEQAEARIEELEAKLATCEKYKAAYAEFDRIGTQAVRELEAKLEKAVKLAEEAFDFNIEDAGPRAWHSINDRIAELKGQDDE